MKKGTSTLEKGEPHPSTTTRPFDKGTLEKGIPLKKGCSTGQFLDKALDEMEDEEKEDVEMEDVEREPLEKGKETEWRPGMRLTTSHPSWMWKTTEKSWPPGKIETKLERRGGLVPPHKIELLAEQSNSPARMRSTGAAKPSRTATLGKGMKAGGPTLGKGMKAGGPTLGKGMKKNGSTFGKGKHGLSLTLGKGKLQAAVPRKGGGGGGG